MKLLGRRKFAVVVDRAPSYAHNAVDVNWSVCIIHSIALAAVHDVAVLRLPRLVGCDSGDAPDRVPGARHLDHLRRTRGLFETDVSERAASASGSSATHVGRSVELLSSARVLLALL